MSLLLLLNQDGDAPVELHTHTFTLLNAGDADLHIGTVSLEPVAGTTAFSIISDAASGRTVAPDASVTVRVRFAPTVAGAHLVLLHVPSDDPDGTLTVDVTGTGVTTAAPDITVDPPATWDAGSVNIAGGTAVRVFVVANIGNADLTVGTVSLTGAAYAKSADTASGVVIAHGEAESFTITFDPSTAATHTGSVTVPSDDAGGSVVVGLTGVGIATPPPPPPPVPIGRFYLSRQAAPSVAGITNSGWNKHTADASNALTTAKGGPAVTWGTPLAHTGVNGQNARLGRWIGPPLAAQVVSTSFLCYAIGYRQNALGTNVTSAIRFGIWRAASGTVEWQSVLSTATAGSSAWPDSTDPLPRRFPKGDPWAWSVDLTIAAGDRLVVELGFRAFSSSTGTVRMRWGGQTGQTDLASTQDAQDIDLAPWLAFSDPLLVLA